MVPKELASAELDRSFGFTKGAPVMRIDALTDARRIPCVDGNAFQDVGTKLYHTGKDPLQQHPISDPEIENRMTAAALRILSSHECPADFYDWLGLTPEATNDIRENN